MGNVTQIIKPQTETGIQPEKQGSQGTREILPLPMLGYSKASRLSLAVLSLYISSSAGIKGVWLLGIGIKDELPPLVFVSKLILCSSGWP